MITAEQVQNKLEDINKSLKNSVQSINEEVEKHGRIGAENQQKLNQLAGNIEDVTARVLEIEQKGTSQRDIDAAVVSVGAQFTDSESFEAFKTGNTTKATFQAENNVVVGGDSTVAPDRRAGIIGGPVRKLRLMDVIPQGTTTSNSIEYTRELLFTNDAAETQEGDFAYPESDITFELAVAPVKNIGHFIYVSKQMLEDAPTIASYIDGRLRYGVEFRKDYQALRGDGTGQNIAGLFSAGNYTALAGATTGDDQYKNIRRAIAQAELAEYPAEVIFLNPADCSAIDLVKGTDDHFIGANPRYQTVKTIWGLPVIETNAMQVGKFLVASLSMAAQFTNRRGTIVEMSDSDGTNFTKDMVTLKATARAALEVYRPASMVGGDLVTP